MTTGIIERLRQQIVEKMESGEDVSALSQQLAQERAKLTVQTEEEELRKVADQRKEWERKADEIKAKVAKQDSALDRFLTLRDTIVGKLQPLLEPVMELAKMATMNRNGPGEVFSEFPDAFQFGEVARNIPKGYLPEGFSCPILELAPGTDPSYDKTSEAAYYFQTALGILSNLRKGVMTTVLRSVDDGVGRSEEPEDNPDLSNSCLICKICKHPEVVAINKALQDGTPLRDIEAEFGTSKSSLSRHKQHVVNVG